MAVNDALKIDAMGTWIDEEWKPAHPDESLITLWSSSACVDSVALSKFNRTLVLPNQYQFTDTEVIPCPVVSQVNRYSHTGDLTYRSGAFLYRFTQMETGEEVRVLIVAAFFSDEPYYDPVCVACMPDDFRLTWTAFSIECNRVSGALEPTEEVVIIGGRSASFVPTVEWDDIVLPIDLKTEILEDVNAFFRKGIEVYKRLKLKPFRKLLLAGVPGTGKTMICSALAKWAIDQQFLVIYISSADRAGSTFAKIEHALAVASSSSLPTLILLEELDAYLHEEDEKALILNVLDGSESLVNNKGTLLVATTNHPEAIDERVLKRPGRLDRIFIIPETRNHEDAEKMLRQYLGEMWQEDHIDIAQELIGYPGAFIREVAIYALTQVAYEDLPELSYEILQRSFNRLRDQIDARDDFLIKRGSMGLLTGNGRNS
jgi:hypothetical protein